MTASAIILAAGCGNRMEAGENKVFLPIGKHPIICHSVWAFSHLAEIDELVIVAQAQEIDRIRRLFWEISERLLFVEGGASRRDSSLAGVRAASGDLVLIHDAARPFPSPLLIQRVLAATQRTGAALPVLALTDLLHPRDDNGLLRAGEDGTTTSMVRAQTPQGFRRDLILGCLEAANANLRDDAQAVLQSGKHVATVDGEPTNIKITHPADLRLAGAIAAQCSVTL